MEHLEQNINTNLDSVELWYFLYFIRAWICAQIFVYIYKKGYDNWKVHRSHKQAFRLLKNTLFIIPLGLGIDLLPKL